MKLKEIKNKIKFKKADVSNILSFVLLFTLFFSLMIAMMFNSITQERRSMMVDYLNKEAMVLQANLRGYSSNDIYCYMYDNGVRVTDRGRMEQIKNNAIDQTKAKIQAKFEENRYKSQMALTSIDISVTDGGSRTDMAKIKIVVKYRALFRSPFNQEEGDSGNNSAGKLGISIVDTVSRTIENPIRLKNSN